MRFRFLLSVLVVLFVSQAQAQTQTQTKPLGRLFFTPVERASLDHMRKTGVKPEEPNASKEAVVPVPGFADQTQLQLTVNGVVRRANGKSTTWLNQTAIEENQVSQNIRVKQSASRPSLISIYLEDGKQAELKVGQSVDRANGQVQDVLGTESNKVKVKTDKSKAQKP